MRFLHPLAYNVKLIQEMHTRVACVGLAANTMLTYYQALPLNVTNPERISHILQALRSYKQSGTTASSS